MKREFSERIPFFSFLATCGIVLYHCETSTDILPLNTTDLYLNQEIQQFFDGYPVSLCMYWFFGITAFLLFHKLSFSTIKRKLPSRVRTLLVPYVLWQFIYIGKSLLQGNKWTIEGVFAQTFFLRIWPPLPPFWYIYTVFLLSLLSPLFLLFYRYERIGWISSTASIVFLYLFWRKIEIPCEFPLYLDNIKMYLPAYIIGAFCGSVYRDDNPEEVLAYAIGFLLVGLLLDSWVDNLLIHMVLAVLPMLLLFLLPIPVWANNRGFYRACFLIYATHESIISICLVPIQRLLIILFSSVAAVNLFSKAACCLVTLAINFGVHALMLHYTPRTLRLLTGGRC